MKIKCPQCGKENEYIPGETEFCVDCGTVLSKKEDDEKKDSLFSELNIREILFSDKTDFSPSTACPFLRVEYKDLRLTKGFNADLKLRITPLSGEIRELLVYFETDNNGKKELHQLPYNTYLTAGFPFEIRTAYIPERAGSKTINFYFGCKTDQKIQFFMFSAEYEVQSSPTETQTIINISDIGAASDVKVNTSGLFAPIGGKADHEYKIVSLQETSWRPIMGEYRTLKKLILECGEMQLFVLGEKSIKLGRKPEKNDLIVQTLKNGTGPKEYPNTTVSREHAEIVYCEESVKFFDRSSHGTYIDGRRPDSLGIPMKDHAKMEFGDIVWIMDMQRCESKAKHALCMNCKGNNVKSMTFTPEPEDKARYIVVWQCCELGRVYSPLSNWTIFNQDGGFIIRTPEQEFYYLYPGQTIQSGETKIRVNFFQQTI